MTSALYKRRGDQVDVYLPSLVRLGDILQCNQTFLNIMFDGMLREVAPSITFVLPQNTFTTGHSRHCQVSNALMQRFRCFYLFF